MLLILIRGIPGSGKSTRAKMMQELNPALVHLEADMFFEASGEYKFDPTLLSTAHDWCYSNTAFNLLSGKNVVVTNTFTKMWEMESYLAIAQRLGCDITIIEMKSEYGSIHGVPEAKLQQMKARWEELPEDLKKSIHYYEVK